jgi:hypothetical protein
MSMGRGSLSSMLKKQKRNTRSSTEAELVGADDAMPQIMWTNYFIETHGHGISDNILYQDNLSTMLLEKNGKNPAASGPSTSVCGIFLSRTESTAAT